jgi:uncharacterized damage-inducible protein DinB
MSDEALGRMFVDYAKNRLDESLKQIEKCLRLLTVEQVWQRPNEVSNAVGNLVLHLTGNVRLWIVASFGGEPYQRNRPAEFGQREPLPTEQILGGLRETVDKAGRVITGLSPEVLARPITIQGYQETGLTAVFHVVEHFSLHTGQIVYATKLLTGKDLSLYDAQGRRLDGKTAGVP